MTLLVGQINEARQFVAFIPVATALFMAAFANESVGPGAPQAVSTHGPLDK